MAKDNKNITNWEINMKKVTTELDIHSVRIHIKSDERYNKAAIAFFSVFASLISLFPVLAIILFLSFDEAKVLGLVVATFFSLYVAFYLWRLVLWNVCGKETITISKNRLLVVNDYRFFKEKSQDWKFDNLRISSYKNDIQNGKSNICIKSSSNEYISNNIIDTSEIEKIKTVVYYFFKSKTVRLENVNLYQTE